MSRRELWLSAGAVFVLALAVRAVIASAIPYPVPEDTAYYVGVARNLVEGHGLVSDALWSYQTPPLTVPRAAFEIWLPLPTFLAALPMALFGPTFKAAQAGAVVVGALVPVLAWRLAADVAGERGLPRGRARVLALGSGLVACVYGPLAVHGALPDSTMPFAALALAACILMTRLLREEVPPRAADPRLVGLGILLGLAALARNEAVWLALAWAALASWTAPRAFDRRARIRLIAVPAAVALACYAPWMVRDWLAFGSPLPGQALANALSVSGFDIFAWQDRPTLGRYLAQGPAWLIGSRVDGFEHNLFDVLLVPAIPAGPIGLAALWWQGRSRALRPLLVLSVATFAATTLAFPVASEWGTFLHAAGPVHVLLLISCLLFLDASIARIGRWRGWTNPVAWLGPALVVATAVPVLAISIGSISGVGVSVRERYEALDERLRAAGIDPSSESPLVVDFPIWAAWSLRVPTLGLPDEDPSSVADLAHRFGAGLLVITGADHGRWPGVLDDGGPGTGCFAPLDLPGSALAPPGGTTTSDGALTDTRVYRILCR